jgi:hypothetical protein
MHLYASAESHTEYTILNLVQTFIEHDVKVKLYYLTLGLYIYIYIYMYI